MTLEFTIKQLSRSAALLLLGAATLTMTAGCGSGGDDDSSGSSSTGGESSGAPATVPAGFFADAAPTESPMLIDVKNASSVGDEVTFTARIGGLRDPFTKSAAMFLVVDPSLRSCDQIPGDNCPYPWDYCCEPKDNLRAHMATVQLVGEDGSPVSGTLSGMEGLTGGATIIVTGTVSEKDDQGTFVVDAASIHVAQTG